jgi:hypothetical protein
MKYGGQIRGRHGAVVACPRAGISIERLGAAHLKRISAVRYSYDGTFLVTNFAGTQVSLARSDWRRNPYESGSVLPTWFRLVGDLLPFRSTSSVVAPDRAGRSGQGGRMATVADLRPVEPAPEPVAPPSPPGPCLASCSPGSGGAIQQQASAHAMSVSDTRHRRTRTCGLLHQQQLLFRPPAAAPLEDADHLTS